MKGVNKVILIGNLGADPDVRQLPSGGVCATISMATTKTWTDKTTQEKKERTEWHRVVLFNRLAEIAQNYLKKGAGVFIEGELRNRKYTDSNNIERYVTEIYGDSLQMLGSSGGGRPNIPFPDQDEYASQPVANRQPMVQANQQPMVQQDDGIPEAFLVKAKAKV